MTKEQPIHDKMLFQLAMLGIQLGRECSAIRRKRSMTGGEQQVAIADIQKQIDALDYAIEIIKQNVKATS